MGVVAQPKVCANCGHPRNEHVARVGVGCTHPIDAVVFGTGECPCGKYVRPAATKQHL